MSFQNGSDDEGPSHGGKLVDLSEMRRAQQTLRKRVEAEAKTKKSRQLKGSQRSQGEPIRWFHYIQLILFLAVVAYLSQKCHS